MATTTSRDRLNVEDGTERPIPVPLLREMVTSSKEQLNVEEGTEPPPTRISKSFGHFSVHIIALLAPASIFGLLARLGIVALSTYNGQALFPLAYVQALGCFIMGFVLTLKRQISDFYPPFYIALTTGFCGSLTTFSSWQLDVFASWINSSDFDRSGLRDFIDGVGKSIITVVLSLVSVSLGAALAGQLEPYMPILPPPSFHVRYVISISSLLSYGASVLAYFLLPPSYRHQATAALLFAFPGTLMRYILAVRLNSFLLFFPIGTFIANIFGTAVLSTIHVLQGLTVPVSHEACALLQGLGDGYCGCLTTISTFAIEINALKGRNKFRYLLASWILAQICVLLIWGTSIWTGTTAKQTTCSMPS